MNRAGVVSEMPLLQEKRRTADSKDLSVRIDVVLRLCEPSSFSSLSVVMVHTCLHGDLRCVAMQPLSTHSGPFIDADGATAGPARGWHSCSAASLRSSDFAGSAASARPSWSTICCPHVCTSGKTNHACRMRCEMRSNGFGGDAPIAIPIRIRGAIRVAITDGTQPTERSRAPCRARSFEWMAPARACSRQTDHLV